MRHPREDIVAGLLSAYRDGAFPMADPRTGDISFYTADPRAILPLDDHFHTPRTVARDLRRERFRFTTDAAFRDVVRGCAAPRPGTTAADTWLSPALARWAGWLHDAGAAHSIEAWLPLPDGTEHLAGGVYGVSIGTAFFGESMFTSARPRRTDGTRDPCDGTGASAACLVRLVRHLRACGYTVFDAQIPNAHTERFGLIHVDLAVYLKDVRRAAAEPDAWRPL